MSRHRYPNVRTPWYKRKQQALYLIDTVKRWVAYQRQEITDIVAELKKRQHD